MGAGFGIVVDRRFSLDGEHQPLDRQQLLMRDYHGCGGLISLGYLASRSYGVEVHSSRL
jgi:hypothetical protein